MARLAVCFLALFLSALQARGAVLNFTWEPSGVATYASADNPLMVQLGDVVQFICPNGSFSNIIYQTNRAQFEACNISAAEGSVVAAGSCGGTRPILQILRVQIAQSSFTAPNTQQYVPGLTYYLTSYSDGQSATSARTQQSSGGECLDGLKIALSVLPASTSAPTTDGSSTGSPTSDANEPGTSAFGTEALIGIAVGGAAMAISIVVVLIIVCCCCYCSSRKGKARLHSSVEAPAVSMSGVNNDSSPKKTPKKTVKSSGPQDSISSTRGLISAENDDIDSTTNNKKQAQPSRIKPPDRPVNPAPSSFSNNPSYGTRHSSVANKPTRAAPGKPPLTGTRSTGADTKQPPSAGRLPPVINRGSIAPAKTANGTVKPPSNGAPALRKGSQNIDSAAQNSSSNYKSATKPASTVKKPAPTESAGGKHTRKEARKI